MIFSNIFLSILHNIGLYIYTVKYKSGIKIPGFLRNISKKNQNILKKCQKLLNQFPFSKTKKNILFSCIRPNPKIFPSIFFIKKTKIASFSCLKNKNEYRNQFMIIH